MTVVKKGNIELSIDENELSAFLAKGYDQIDGGGRITKQATGGKSVSVEEYNKLLAENAGLKKKLAEKSGKKKQSDETASTVG